jgi:hypothetical protein
MVRLREILLGTAGAALLACVPLEPALAGDFRWGLHPWGVGRGLVGAAVGLATLPLAIASAVVTGGEPRTPYPAPDYAGGYGYSYGYAPRAIYAAPPAYALPRAAYYPSARAYFYGPRPYYYAPRPGYAVHGYYRPGGYAYPHR